MSFTEPARWRHCKNWTPVDDVELVQICVVVEKDDPAVTQLRHAMIRHDHQRDLLENAERLEP